MKTLNHTLFLGSVLTFFSIGGIWIWALFLKPLFEKPQVGDGLGSILLPLALVFVSLPTIPTNFLIAYAYAKYRQRRQEQTQVPSRLFEYHFLIPGVIIGSILGIIVSGPPIFPQNQRGLGELAILLPFILSPLVFSYSSITLANFFYKLRQK